MPIAAWHEWQLTSSMPQAQTEALHACDHWPPDIADINSPRHLGGQECDSPRFATLDLRRLPTVDAKSTMMVSLANDLSSVLPASTPKGTRPGRTWAILSSLHRRTDVFQASTAAAGESSTKSQALPRSSIASLADEKKLQPTEGPHLVVPALIIVPDSGFRIPEQL